MKSKLLDELFKKFEKDKKVIKENVLVVMDNVTLETSDRYGKVTMTITYEENKIGVNNAKN